MDDADSDDPRCVELEALEAIYPEILRPNAHDPFTFELHLPVEPATPITVTFPAASGPTATAAATAAASSAPLPGAGASAPPAQNGAPDVDSRQVTHLPSLSLRMTLPKGYPGDFPPQIKISTDPQWLSAEAISRLEDDGPRLWEETGRDMVAYTYIDHLQRAADDVFGTITADGTLAVHPDHKLAVLDYDIKARKTAFERETFDCGICLDPKKGSKCHKMLDCGHIFCLQCLCDFYTDAIEQGSLETVRCLKPDCARDRAKAQAARDKQGRKPKTSISPSELLQIGLSGDNVKRYVTLKYKTELESDKNTIYCPRQWCGGAARSKKHKKPDGLDFAETSDPESDGDEEDAADGAGKVKKQETKFDRADLLSVCEDCSFAFCSRCFQSWHGEYVMCQPKRDDGELTEEEKASLEYIQLHTSPCPTCGVPAQKTHGCNHMICSRCNTHFCYLCSSWLDPDNPYKHYNTQPMGKVTGCYMRLWELEEGDGDNVGLGFAGGHQEVAEAPEPVPAPEAAPEAPAPAPAQVRAPALDPAANPLENLGVPARDLLDRLPQDNRHNPRDEVAVAREAPLVLRLMDNRPVPPQAPAAPPAADGRNVRGGANRGGPPRGRGARSGRARGARGRGGRGGAGAGAVADRQNQGRAPNNNNNNNNAAAAGAPNAANVDINWENAQGLDAAQQAWVRRFVQMALIDAEDQVDGDSDSDEGENWVIR